MPPAFFIQEKPMRHLSPAQYEVVSDLANLKQVQAITGWDEYRYSCAIRGAADARWRRRRLKRIARYTRLVEMGKPLGGQT
jgi:hypothetical protein